MKKLKKAFTLTELVIVIAVIAILAAVLIPTYTSLVRKANISSDTQLAASMNTILQSATNIEDMQDVIQALEDEGYGIGKLNPTTENYRFVWDETSNQILLLDENFVVVSNAKEYSEETWNLWLTVKNPAEVTSSLNTRMNFNYFLANDYSGNFSLTTLSSFSTGDYTLSGNLSLATPDNGLAIIDGTIDGTLTIDTPNATISQYGAAQTAVVTRVDNDGFNVCGFIQALTVAQGIIVLKPASYVTTLTYTATSTATVVNNSIIGSVYEAIPATATLTNTDGYVEIISEEQEITNPDNFTVQIGTLAQLEAFRDAVNNGATYDGITVQLISNIALKDGWTPIGEFARKSRGATVTTTLLAGELIGFAGTFDGNSKTISNLNNIGYVVKSTALFENDSTQVGKQEFAYGLFGVVSDAIIKNLTLTSVNINIPNGTNTYGDSVGAIIGYSCGDLIIENCRATGIVSAYDGVGGLVGRAYLSEEDKNKQVVIFGSSILFKDCTSEIRVIGNEKAGGIAGYISTASKTIHFNVTFDSCLNKGSVDAGSETATPGNVAWAGGMTSKAITLGIYIFTNCENQGNITSSYTLGTALAHQFASAFASMDCSETSCINTGTITINPVEQ